MDLESFPFKVKRDLRVASPQPLFRSITDLLEERSFRLVQSEPPELVPGALPGTASFKAYLVGIQDFTANGAQYLRAGLFLAIGLVVIGAFSTLMVVSAAIDNFLLLLGVLAGVILGGLGIGQIRELRQRVRHLVEVRLEGESYQAGASTAGRSTPWSEGEGARVERVGIVSDVRVTLSAGVGVAKGDSEVSRWLPRRKAEVIPISSPAPGKLIAPTLEERRLDRQLDTVIEQFALTEGS